MANDREWMDRAIAVAEAAERLGNLPIGAVVTLDGEAIASSGNSILQPAFHPGRHAEVEALRAVPADLWPRSREMTCYSTLEPCVMCFGSLLLHGIGRIVYGAADPAGGAGVLIAHLPSYYADGEGVPEWIGPVDPERCDVLFERSIRLFDLIPSLGRGQKTE